MADRPTSPRCAVCSVRERICQAPEGTGPDFCPTVHYRSIAEASVSDYRDPALKEFVRQSTVQEAVGYTDRDRDPDVLHPVKPRVQEICELAHRMGYRRLGVAFCEGLRTEARILNRILEAQGFEVVSVVCKTGCTPKETVGIRPEEKVRVGRFESMCSPVVQARILNAEETQFNILVGLCVGHDSLFFKYSDAFATVLVAKDRVLAHNPAAALYAASGYYQRLLRPGIDLPEDPDPGT